MNSFRVVRIDIGKFAPVLVYTAVNGELASILVREIIKAVVRDSEAFLDEVQ